MKVALLQLKTLPTPKENLEKIKQMLVQAKQEGADLVVLPEMCCCPYENSAFVRYAMPENAPFLPGHRRNGRGSRLVCGRRLCSACGGWQNL